MGRLQRIHRKKRHRKQKRVPSTGCTEVLESEPELSRPGVLESLSSGDEEESSVSLPASPTSLSLALSSSLPFQDSPSHNAVHIKSIGNVKPASSPTGTLEEMEVTRKMSSLSFAMAVNVHRDIGGFSGPTGLQAGLNSLMREVEEGLSEGELCSELTSATQLDLLPTLSDKEFGQECMEEMEVAKRRARKRPSRRKPTRRTKKQRAAGVMVGMGDHRSSSPKVHRGIAATSLPSIHHPLAQNFVRTSSKETPHAGSPSATGEGFSKHISRARSFRRTRRSKQEEDPLFCFLSDTSVAPDMDVPSLSSSYNKDVEWVEPYYDAAPREVVEEEMEEESVPNESDLTETTTDSSGCDGDDEESSVEGPCRPLPHYGALPTAPPGLLNPSHHASYPRWREGGSPEDAFHHILEGSLPLLTAEGRYKIEQMRESLNNSGGLGMEVDHHGNDGRGRFSEFVRSRNGGKKKRCNPRELANSLSLREVNQRIVTFIQQQQQQQQVELSSNGMCEGFAELKFQLVSRSMCRTIAALAGVYNLTCLVEESKRRLPVASPRLRITPLTKMATKEEIEPILRQHGQKEASVIMNRGRDTCKFRTDSFLQDCRHGNGPTSAGQPVASGCKVIDEHNVGNQMLQGMGWSPGMGLGRNSDGIKSPVKAYLRTKHAGLGFV